MRPIHRTHGVLAAAIALACAGAQAQTAPVDGLDEIIVTAQKRAQSVLDVPISMSVVQGDTLRQLAIVDFADLQDYVPNLTLTPTPSNSFVFIRGIGTQGQTLSFESSVALFVDGIYGGRNRQFQDPFLDVGRVEVLRGPQGALFGRNTSAGAISVTSARPTRELEASVQGDYEVEFGTWTTTGVLSGPVGDNVQMRFAAKYLDDPGYLRNVGLNRDEPSRKSAAGRVSVAWQPTESVDVFARLEYTESDVTGMPFEFVPNRGQPVLVKRTDDAFAPEGDDSDALNASVEASFALGGHTLTAIAGYSEFSYEAAINIQAKAPALLVVQNAEDFDQTSLELRLLSPSEGRFEYVAGVYADTATSLIPSTSTTDLPFTPVRPDGITTRRYTEDTDSWAAFVQGTWNFTDTVRATAGVRYTAVDKEGNLARFFVGAAPGARNTPLAMQRDESFVDPSFNVQWDFAQRWMAFASYAQGSKSGGFNGPSSTDTVATWMFEDEGSESIEVGVKGGSGAASLSVVLFDTTYTDLQKSVLNINTASFTVGNAAEAQSRGVEVEGAWRATDGLTLSTAFAYLDAEFTDYPGAPCPYQVPGTSCNLKGFPLTSAPEWSGNASATYERPLGSALKLVAGVVATYRDLVWYQPSYNPLESQDAYWKLDVRAGLAAADDRWSATLLVRNATDEDTSSLIFETFPFGLNTQTDRVHAPDRPRTYTLQLRWRFD